MRVSHLTHILNRIIKNNPDFGQGFILFFYNNVAKAVTNIQMIVQDKLSSDLLDIIV